MAKTTVRVLGIALLHSLFIRCGPAQSFDPSVYGARAAALAALERGYGAAAANIIANAPLSIETVDAPFLCAGSMSVGCTRQLHPSGAFSLVVAGEPDGCEFRRTLTHELLHVFLCLTPDVGVGAASASAGAPSSGDDPCDQDHVRPQWSVMVDTQRRVSRDCRE